jgi:hypothetical protein
MKILKLIAASAVLGASGAAIADQREDSADVKAGEPVQLTADQMDAITAAGKAYGKTIITVTEGLSFGNLVGAAKRSGEATHGNYAGGARALVETVCVHVPSAC